MAEWSRELDIRLSGWCCSVSMEWVQILSRENKNLSAQRFNPNPFSSVGLNYQTNFHFNHECQHIFPVRLCCYCLKNLNFHLMEFFLSYPRSTGGGYTVLPLSVRPSVCPSVRPKIFFVAFFSATIDDTNLIFGHKLHIGTPYRGKRFSTRQIPTSCLTT